MCGGAGGALAISYLAMGTVADAAEKLGAMGGYREATALATVVLWIAALSSVSLVPLLRGESRPVSRGRVAAIAPSDAGRHE